MISLPKMGRPSVSGLSVKALGLAEYKRRYYALHHTPKTSRRWWTGLHASKMTHAAYTAAWRALKATMCHPDAKNSANQAQRTRRGI